MFKIQLFSKGLSGIMPDGRRAGRAALAVLLLVWLSVAGAVPATAQGNPYAMIGEVSRVEYAMPFERMPRLVNADTTGDTAAMLIDGYGGKIHFVDASDSILGTAELPEDAVLMWLSVDPMADKYPGISPYHYCHWNPIRLVDPDGMEDWEVDRLGRITKCKVQPENPTEDRIRVKGTEGWTEKNSLSGLTRGTISEQNGWKCEGEKGSIVQLQGSRQDRVNLFMFCADNADVEFSLIELDNGNIQFSLLTTSHDKRAVGKDRIGDALGSALSIKNAGSLTSHIHNHFGNGTYGWFPSDGDFSFRDAVYEKQKEIISMYPSYHMPNSQFGIYRCRGRDRNIYYYNK